MGAQITPALQTEAVVRKNNYCQKNICLVQVKVSITKLGRGLAGNVEAPPVTESQTRAKPMTVTLATLR